MKSFKTIKIAVISGLMLNLAMPVQAGFAESAKAYFEKAVTFSKNNPATSALAFIFGTSALGAGIGYTAAKNNTALDKTTMLRIIDKLNAAPHTGERIEDNIDQLTSLRQIDRNLIKEQIRNYHASFTGNYSERASFRTILINSLNGYVYELENRPQKWAIFGAATGMSITFLPLVAAQLLKSVFNPKH